MARGVVIRRRVAGDLRAAQFVDVAVAVHTVVVRAVDQSLLFWVIVRVLPQAAGGIAVLAENYGLVVQRHPGDRMGLSSGPGRLGAPRLSAEQISGISIGRGRG